MAYSEVEDNHLKNVKYQQYYPEESDSSEFYQYYSENKQNVQIPYRNPKNIQKGMPVFNYEKKCPIYVHEFNKMPNGNMYNNYIPKNFGRNILNPQPPGSQSSRSVIDKLEETYWATWKPNKERTSSKSPRRYKERNGATKNKAYGDVSDMLVKYFAGTNFETSTPSVVIESDNYRAMKEPDVEYGHFVEMNSQEIQTEELPKAVENINERKKDLSNETEISKSDETNIDINQQQMTISETNMNIPKKKSVDSSGTNNSTEIDNNEKTILVKNTFSKILKHTDSFILTKKKQSETKETYQQPKCIKLYKKSGSSYVRGGTYPLKSCLRREGPSPKGNFRLGPPGSPLFVTSNSFNKRF